MMDPNTLLAALVALIVSGFIAWQFFGDRRHTAPLDAQTRRRRYKTAWEVRLLVVVTAGPFAAGIFLGYVSTDYTLPLLLFVAAGLVVAQLIAPSGLRRMDR